jgi:AraC-like DNA-binding protein
VREAIRGNVKADPIHLGFGRYSLRAPLSDYVDYLWIYTGYTAAHQLERVLPTGTMGLVIRLDNDCDSAIVAGARSESLVLDTSRPFSVIAASFKPGGAFPFFGLPAGKLHNVNVPLEMFWGVETHWLREELLEAQTMPARFRILERFLLRRLQAHGGGRSPAVRYAVDHFQRSAGMPRIAAVAERVGWTAGKFIHRFRDEVGMAPKTFCRVARFQSVLRTLEGRSDVDWADVASSCGYFDQAHFGHDFREFAGTTPSEYLRRRTSTNHIRLGR